LIVRAASGEEPFNDEVPPLLPQKHIAIWSFETNQLSNPIKVNGEFGNLFAINETLAWDMYKFPKIINIKTGEVENKVEGINSGLQVSSILHDDIKNYPQICFDRQTSLIATKIDSTTIEVLASI
jgi:hypothetical protein